MTFFNGSNLNFQSIFNGDSLMLKFSSSQSIFDLSVSFFRQFMIIIYGGKFPKMCMVASEEKKDLRTGGLNCNLYTLQLHSACLIVECVVSISLSYLLF